MKSKTTLKILKETSKETKQKAKEYADSLIKKNQIKNKV